MSKPGGPEGEEGEVWVDPALAVDPVVARALGRVGATLHDKWRLDALLGIGGTAAVYAATHRNGSRAAVKILNPEFSQHVQVRERFFREGYAANAVGHEGTVKVFDDDEAHDGSLFLVTELLDGEALEDRRVRLGGRLDEAEVLWLTDQLLDVLAAAHAKGIIHRDLKPENVFLTRGGVLKVLDFGIAALREISWARSGTITGAIMGTPAYMPPEQALGLWDEVDARSDVWAWGATMFHLLSGQVIHGGRTPNEQLSRAVTNAAPPLLSVAPGVSPALAEIVDRALRRAKDGRWPDARTMQDAIRTLYLDRFSSPMAALGDVAPPPPVTEGERRSTPTFRATALPVGEGDPAPSAAGGRRRRTWLALGGALALAIVGTCTHSLRPEEPSPGAPATQSASPPPAPAPVPLVPLPPESSSDGGADLAQPAPSNAGPPATKKGAPAARPNAAAKDTSTPACTPPYVIEPDTGKRRWKLECL
ncbi:MAG TPA: serine/threonine-protein kinase [Polyangiaceae bacterium]|jgi:serine/threonine-protein kinase